MKRRMSRVSAKAFILGLIATVALAGLAVGSETGEIRGKVVDDGGLALPGVEIRAAGPALQGIRTVFSTKEGIFQFPLLPVGRYTLTFKLPGFTTVVQENAVVRLGLTTTLTVRMPQAAIETEVVVTAETPLLDKNSTDTSYRLSATDLEKIPAQNRTIVDVVKFTPGATGVRADTRRGTATEGQPSFRGAGAEGNNWIIDGLAVSGVRLKDSGVKLNFDSLEEIQIISDPFSPEYGSAYGGIINMVTKSGSNRFHGEASLLLENKHLQAARESQLSVVSEPNAFSNTDAYINLGGPIFKDKLWFFLSENFQTVTQETKDGTLDYLVLPGGTKTVGRNNVFGKVSFAPHVNHNLSLTFMQDKSIPQKGGIGLPEMNEEKRAEDLMFRLNYKGILSARTFIEAGLGQVRRNLFTTPVDGDLGPAMYYVKDLARNIHNSYGNVTDNERRFDAGVKITTFAETERFGRHEIGAGLEYYDVSSTFKVDFTGKDEDLFPGNGFDIGTKYVFDSWKGGIGIPAYFYEYGPFDLLNSSRGIGLFLKDKVSWDRFTIMAGLRSQTQTCLSDSGGTLWNWGLGDFLSPRISFTADLTNDGRNVLKLAWGRFSDMITTMALGFFNAGMVPTYRFYHWIGPASPTEADVHNPDSWAYDYEQNQKFEINNHIKPDFQTRWLIEFDHRIGKTWAAKARFVRTQGKNLLELLTVLNLKTMYSFLYDNFEYKRRDYAGIEFEVNGQIGRSLFLNASYAHALARGTNPGQSEAGAWSQEEGSTYYLGMFGNHLYVPDLPELAELKEFSDANWAGLGGRGIGDEGWYGRLPYSVDHNVKINALYSAPGGIQIAGAFEYISGYPWEKMGWVPFFQGFYSFPEGRGTRTTPPLYYLDLSFEKSFPLPGSGFFKDAAIAVRLDIFNVFNSQQPISYVKEDVSIFGSVWGRQQPRQARLSAKIKF
ncbi:MAG: carboxypeptidase regulatory-like domain-containing protein [Candidatus Aminicenantes bacterium]|nr:carboxypeptidase regulatory-like domain-containing protein [Candidatus Aminicenantes bacterium]